ncbi:MAG: 4-hydroxy-3-methylbut-2-enyl diphosphate reductase [Bacteroidota bacterium]
MQVKLANPRSFCAGVTRAIDIVEKAIDVYGPPIYVLHEIVHNRFVVKDLEEKGAIFVEELSEIPDGVRVVFSAHGVAKSRELEARRKDLTVLDATCPLVAKVHQEVKSYSSQAKEVVLIGHAKHVEVIGTIGQYDRSSGGEIYLVGSVEEAEKLVVNDPDNLGYVTQTTLSIFDTQKIVDALKKRFPKIVGPKKDDICYATQNRQQAIIGMADEIDILLVVGAKNSSNSNRLREVGENLGLRSYLIQSADNINAEWFNQNVRIGVTAGASAPEVLVQGVIERLNNLGASSVQEVDGERENVIFSLPAPLKEDIEKTNQTYLKRNGSTF